jgi:hypothetical protein
MSLVDKRKVRMALKRSAVILAAVLLMGTGLPSSAQNSRFPATKPVQDRFVVEYVYNFWKQTYQPTVVFKPIAKADASLASPEDCFMHQWSAMAAQDFEWWMSGWDEASQEMMAARNKKMKRGPEFWEERWGLAMKDQRILLVERVDTGPFAMLIYKMQDKLGETTMHSMHICKQVGLQWYATQELAEDPMQHQYLEGKRRVTINVR